MERAIGHMSGQRASAGLLAAVVLLAFVGLLMPVGLVFYFGLSVGTTATVHYHIWAVFTAGAVDTNFLVLVGLIAATFVGTPALERAWGAGPLLKYLGVVSLFSNGFMVLVLIVMYAAQGGSDQGLTRTIYGGAGLAAAVVMGMVRATPSSAARVGGVLPLSLVPVSVWAVLSLGAMLGVWEWRLALVHSVYSVVSWCYLRFLMEYPPELPVMQAGQEGWRGMGYMGDDFAFSTLVPDVGPVRPAVQMVANSLFNAVTKMGLCAHALHDARSGRRVPSEEHEGLLVGSEQDAFTVAPVQGNGSGPPSMPHFQTVQGASGVGPNAGTATPDARTQQALQDIQSKIAEMRAQRGGNDGI